MPPIQSDKYQCHIEAVIFSWWWARGCLKHLEKRNKHIKQNCAPSWTYWRAYTGMHGQQNIKFAMCTVTWTTLAWWQLNSTATGGMLLYSFFVSGTLLRCQWFEHYVQVWILEWPGGFSSFFPKVCECNTLLFLLTLSSITLCLGFIVIELDEWLFSSILFMVFSTFRWHCWH